VGHLDEALSAWRAAIGDRHVSTEESQLRSAEIATFPTNQGVAAIVRPATREEVQECVRIADRNLVPLYPISTGKNWGYGSRVPAADGSVLLDLGRLDRIVDYDEELAYVTVEPGVTQAQLHGFLEERGSRLWMDATGSTPVASMLGNIVDRGFGMTPYGDHVGRACGYEVVLADGRLLHTGFSAFPGARVGGLDRWAPGPLLEGLFSQSNLGVVVRLTIPLMPVPEAARTAVFDMDGPDALRLGVDAMRRLQLEGTIRSAPWFGNHYRLMSVAMRYPWRQAGEPPFTLTRSRRLAAGFGIPAWTGAAGLYGTVAQVAVCARRVRSMLRGAGRRLRFIDNAALGKAPVSARRTIELNLHRVYTGGLTDSVRRAYWRKRTPPPVDPDLERDHVGFLFLNASIPFAGASRS
jgi:4-cresol dehydrogenase (hydroxylating)